jgi:SecD/SecF fusion protein
MITGLSTVFLVTVLYIFGGATLKDFAFAMMVGVASGFYSSIFIATPVLTHWKEREPAYRARRERLIAEMGRLPTFPEDNVVAKVGEDGEPVPAAAAPSGAAATRPAPAATPEPAAHEPEPAEPLEAEVAGASDGAAEPAEPAEPEPLTAGAGPEAARPPRSERQQKRRQQRRRRKHGRNR